MKIYTSNQIGVESNCVYPNEINAVDVRSFEKAAPLPDKYSLNLPYAPAPRAPR